MSRHSQKEIERCKRVASKMTVGTGEAKSHSLHRIVKRRPQPPYCPSCGMLYSQCDCWDAVNQIKT